MQELPPNADSDPYKADEPARGSLKMADVARLAGVSVSTVSRALADPEAVALDKRSRVLEVVRTTGYKPHITARNLRAQKTRTVLVVVPTIANPIYPPVLRGLDEELASAGYGFIICNLDNSRDKEAHYVDLALAGQVDAAVLVNGRIPEARGRSLLDANVPLVAICAPIPDFAFPQIATDDSRASGLVVDHLVSLGHRRIAFIGGRTGSSVDKDRTSGFREALFASGIDPATAIRFEGDYTFASGVAAGEKFLELDQRPTAVFSSSDAMAIAFMSTVQQAGLTIPRDVSVVGIDDLEFSNYVTPRLTTVRQPLTEIGRQGARRLLDAIDSGIWEAAITRLQPELVVRASTGRPAR